jgi:membrane-associated phospholipid phosphatase
MYWLNVDLSARLKSVRGLWFAYLTLIIVWTYFYGDITHVQALSQQPWVLEHRALLKILSDDTMYPLYAFFIGMLIWCHYRQQAHLRIMAYGYLLSQLIGSILIVRILKMSLGHARPDQIAKLSNGTLDTWVGPSLASSYHGFPSGHTCDYLVSCIFLAMCLPKTWMRVLALAVAAANGILRIALAKHFPLDVLGGVIIGGLVSLAILQYWVLPRLKAII